MRVSLGFVWLSVFAQSPDGYLWESEPSGGSATTPTAPAAGTTPTAADATGTAAASPATGATPSPAPPKFTYDEDRSTWVDPRKYRAAEAATNAAIRERDRLNAELAAERRRVQALAGVTPKSPTEEADAELQAAFAAKFPHLAKFTPEIVDRMLTSLDRIGSAEEVVSHHWDTHRANVLGQIEERIADELGVETLNEQQRAIVEAAFIAQSRRHADAADPIAGPYNTEFKTRYERADPKLIDEFVRDFSEHLFKPVQRRHAAGVVHRIARVPRDTRAVPLTSTEPKPKPGNLDAAIERAEAIIRERRGLAG